MFNVERAIINYFLPVSSFRIMRTYGPLRLDPAQHGACKVRRIEGLEAATVYGRSLLDIMQRSNQVAIARTLHNSSLPSLSVAIGQVLILGPERAQATRSFAIFVVSQLWRPRVLFYIGFGLAIRK